MADNKAEEAVKEANIKLKVYYTGNTIEDSGWETVSVPIKSDKHVWLIKSDDGIDRGGLHACHQFVEARKMYDAISREIGCLLDAVLVNNKQREAADKMMDKALWSMLCEDNAHEGDYVI